MGERSAMADALKEDEDRDDDFKEEVERIYQLTKEKEVESMTS